jgi:hypothetical protein
MLCHYTDYTQELKLQSFDSLLRYSIPPPSLRVNISALMLAKSIVGDCEMKVVRKLQYKLLPGNWMILLKHLTRCITRVFEFS